MLRRFFHSIVWLYAALVLAFAGAVLSVGSMGFVHEELHRTASLDWQRFRQAKILHSDHFGRQLAVQRLVRTESDPPR